MEVKNTLTVKPEVGDELQTLIVESYPFTTTHEDRGKVVFNMPGRWRVIVSAAEIIKAVENAKNR